MDILTLGAGAIAGYVVANQKPSQNFNKKGASILVLACIDPRFADNLAWFLIHESKLKDDYDLLCLAGASLGVVQTDYPSWKQTFTDHVELAVKLHAIEEIWCVDHLDCGMYKTHYDADLDNSPDIHISTMNELKAMLSHDFPALGFKGFIMDKVGIVKQHL